MSDALVRRRTDDWIEVVLTTPLTAGELRRANNIMLGQLGLEGAVPDDDVYEVIVGDGELILRAKAPAKALFVVWSPSAVSHALETLLAHQRNDEDAPWLNPDGQDLAVAIGALRAALGTEAQ